MRTVRLLKDSFLPKGSFLRKILCPPEGHQATTGLTLVLTLVLAVLPLHAAAAQEAGFPFTITDDSGVKTTFTAPPKRIVSLSPGHTETVFALGGGDRLVAVDSFSNYPAEAERVEPRLVTYPTVSVETVVALKPDLVLSLVEKDDVLSQLRQQNIPTLKLLPRDFDSTSREIADLGRILGMPDRGNTLASQMQARKQRVMDTVADAPRPTLFYELDASDPTRPFAAGPNGYYGQIADLAGAVNIFNDLPSDFGQVSSESVISRNPQLIILADAYEPYSPQTPALVAARAGWDQIAAVQDGAVYAVQADLFSRPSPRLADGLEALAYLVHPERFAGSGGPLLAPSTTGFPFCTTAGTPTFSFGFAALFDALGTDMGDPTECAHIDVASGDTYQQTTKGLAVYHHATNVPSFSSSLGQWQLTPDGLVGPPAR
jgi:iron complex transport system substrate-binding protein